MFVKRYIAKHLNNFEDICRTHKVSSMYAFGSSLKDKFDKEKSDIDLLVELDENDPIEKGELLISLWDQLESFFDTKVDLLTASNLKNPYLKSSIEATKELIYYGSKQKVSA